MKKIYRKLIPLCLGSIVLFSCQKDDEVKSDNGYPDKFSELTVEQNKENLEDNGIKLVNNMTDFKNSSGIKTAIAFSSFLGESTPDNSGMRRHSGIRLINLLSGFGNGKISVQQVLSNLRVTEDENSFESIQQMFEEYSGVYAWSTATNDWVYTKTGTKIVFEFPSTKTGTSNNASFTLFDYKGINTPTNYIEDYSGDLPTKLMADLSVNGNKEISYSYVASYNTEGEPTSLETSLTVNSFKLTVSVSNDSKVAQADYSLKKADQVLIAFGSNASGSFKSTNILESEAIGSVVETSNAYFQLLNIKMAGDVNVKAIDQAVNDSISMDKKIELINGNYKFMVFYVDSNQKIAETEFYKGVRTVEKFNYDTFTYEEVTEDVADIRLIFADKSKADLETYTNTGFTEITDAFNEFADDISDDLD
jgi:hypothetical protein